jgi:hypothetical protein
MMKNSMFAVFLSGALLLHGTLVVTTAVAQEDNRPGTRWRKAHELPCRPGVFANANDAAERYLHRARRNTDGSGK